MNKRLIAIATTAALAAMLSLVACSGSASSSAASSTSASASSSMASSTSVASASTASGSASADSQVVETAFQGPTDDNKYFVQYVDATDSATGTTSSTLVVTDNATKETEVFQGEGKILGPTGEGGFNYQIQGSDGTTVNFTTIGVGDDGESAVIEFEKYGIGAFKPSEAADVRAAMEPAIKASASS